MQVDVVAEDHENRHVLERCRFLHGAAARGLDGDDGLDLVGARLRDLQAERAALAVQQQDAGADLVDLGDIGVDDHLVGRGPARHDLLHVVRIGFDRELHARHELLLGRIGVPGSFAGADAEAFERVGVGQEDRLARPDVRAGKSRSPAFHGVGDIHIPSLADEHVKPAFAAVGRGLVRYAGQAAAVPHQERHLALPELGQEILRVHLLDLILSVGVELRGRPAGHAHDVAHGLA